MQSMITHRHTKGYEDQLVLSRIIKKTLQVNKTGILLATIQSFALSSKGGNDVLEEETTGSHELFDSTCLREY